MDRRQLLISGAALALDGCFGGPAPAPVVPPVTRRVVLHPVLARTDRILRTTVGLRPHRTSGFRVEAERLGKHTVLHHYGHGGGGMSLTWGTASLVADLAIAHPDRTAAVLGAGVAGLTTARQLQRRGFAVTLYAAALPPYTTSNQSLAHWTPASNLVSSEAPTGFEAQFRTAAEVAYRELQVLVGRDYGVDWMDSWTASDREPGGGGHGWLADPMETLGEQVCGPGEHPFPTRFAWSRPTLRIEPHVYLDALVRDVRLAGGRFVVRAFDAREAVLALPERLIVNCTGLGAGALFGDPALVPIKGQLTVLAPQPEVDYCIRGMHVEGGDFLYMAPRSDGIVLGGTAVAGDGSLEPDLAEQDRIVAAHARFHDAMLRP